MTAWQGKHWTQVGQDVERQKVFQKKGLVSFLTYSDFSSVL